MNKFFDIITSQKVYLPILYILVGVIVNSLILRIIDRITFRHKDKGKDKRKDTIVSLGKNIFKYIIMIFVVLGILNVYGVDTTSIIASLGIFAAVIGLAFQDILKDLLAGIAIIFDNKYAVGDTVEINGFKGVVTSLGLRTTKIKAFSGEVKCIGNASFNEVTNFNLADCDLFIKLSVAYDTDIDKLEKVLNDMKKDIIEIDNVKDMCLLGVDELSDSSIIYLIDVTCRATYGVGIKREVLKMVKKRFDKEGINIPYTTVDVNIRK